MTNDMKLEIENFWNQALDVKSFEENTIPEAIIKETNKIEKSSESFNAKQKNREDFTGFKSPIFKLLNSKGCGKFGQ